MLSEMIFLDVFLYRSSAAADMLPAELVSKQLHCAAVTPSQTERNDCYDHTRSLCPHCSAPALGNALPTAPNATRLLEHAVNDITYRCLFGNALRTLAIPAHCHWRLSAGPSDTPATCSRCGGRLIEGAVEGIRINVDSTVWFGFV